MLALVLDLLLLDETNPRSLAYQLASISQHLAGMPQSKQGASLTDERRLILSMLTVDPPRRRRGFRQGLIALRAAGRCAQPAPPTAAAHHGHRAALLQSARGAAAPRAHTARAQAMIYDVSHRTTYRYSTPVAQSQHIVHMSPRAVRAAAPSKGHTLLIEPAPTIRTERVDIYGNRVVLFDIEQEHTELVVHARSTIGVTAPRARRFRGDNACGRQSPLPSPIPNPASICEVARYACASKHTRSTAEIAAYASASFPAGRPVLQGAWNLIERIYDDFTFDPNATDVSTPVTQVLAAAARRLPGFLAPGARLPACMRLSARYVSGYILTSPPPGCRVLPAPTPPTPGSRCGRLGTAGSTSILPTASSPATSTSPSPMAATTTTSARSAACSWAAATTRSMSVSTSCRSPNQEIEAHLAMPLRLRIFDNAWQGTRNECQSFCFCGSTS